MIICLITIDQLVKIAVINNIYNFSITIIDGILNLTYVENTGGAFGVGSNNTFIIIIINVFSLILITKFILSRKNEISQYMIIGLGLILAGGIGNLIDRILRGFVIDYIDINPLIEYPVFNIADICVVIGCLTIGINIIVNIIKEKNVGAHDCALKQKIIQKNNQQGELNERIQNKKRRTRY